MDRRLTNKIRYLLDEWLPPVLRDNYYLMYPLFYIWFGGRNIPLLMDFKSRFHQLSPEEMTALYDGLKEQFRKREGDLTPSCLERMLQWTRPDIRTVLDVGCGRGHLLESYRARGYEVTGVDLVNHLDDPSIPYVQGQLERLPFADRSFDLVTCSHTLEHTVHLASAIRELKRVAARQLLVCVPKQRYYYYTMDLHIQFFPTAAYLVAPFELSDYRIEDCDGDWVYSAHLDDQPG